MKTRLYPRLFSGLLALGALATTHCIRPVKCTADGLPLDFCADVHSDLNIPVEKWVCGSSICPGATPTEHDCYKLDDLVKANITADHHCIAVWPEPDMGAEGTGVGEFGGSSGSTSSTGTTGSTGGWSGTSTSSTSGTSGDVGTTTLSTTAGDTSSSTTATGADTTSATDAGESWDTGAMDTTGPCSQIECANGGTCIAGGCECQGGFDPETMCTTCVAGLTELDGDCVPDRCATNPCNVGEPGHGDTCEVIGAHEGDYECSCLGDYDPASGCLACEGEKVPDTGHACQDPPPICQDVECRIRATCDPSSGECRCDDPDAFMDRNGGCYNPCDDDPCHVSDGGHGESCRPTSVSTYECRCTGGHVPDSDCEDCPPGQSDPDGHCEKTCPSGQTKCSGDCIDTDTDDDHCGTCSNACNASESCERGKCTSICPEGEIMCAPGCIDPMTSDNFCGAIDDCLGENDGRECGSRESCVNGSCAPQLVCPAGSVKLPGGTYTDNDGNGPHTIPDMCMHITEVTLETWLDCFDRGPCGDPGSRFSQCNAHDPEDHVNHPVNCVTLAQAETYCGSIGMRLPTGPEWEWAARGRDDGRTYPWGNAPEPNCDLVQMDRCPMFKTTVDVDTLGDGRSRDGLRHMAGNLWEMTSDGKIWGGGYGDAKTAQTSSRWLPWEDAGLGFASAVGFRCVKTDPSTAPQLQ